ncbi:MAG TPA: protein kinase, partial [Vicinamibacterales bacterium]|nr:protein kinase [Vicinamibacterales bacterium]
MEADRWQRISRIFHEALERPVDQRDTFLDACCQGDDVLRGEVASLLAHEASAESFLVNPAAEVVDARLTQSSEPPHAGLEPGVSLGTYRIERPLGRGGMGVVFLAHDTTLHRKVALKVLGSPTGDGTARDRLLREARNAAALNHPNICTVYEVGESADCAFIAMEYVDGQSLSDRLLRGPLLLEEVLRYGIDAADALGYAHEHGVVHRDFKAANVIVTAAGRLKVVDFGLARRGDAMMAGATTMPTIAPAGVAAGTPYAMAPEQVRGDTSDARTDIWALGVLLYEMATGAKPFNASTVPELFSSILRDAPKPWPATVPVEIRPVIERCLEKEPGRRYEHAGEVDQALDAIRSGFVPPWVAWRYHLTRRRGLASAAALVVVAALLAAANVGGARDWLLGRPSATAAIKLAVLPFENLTGDPEQEFFSDGLTEEMITQLGRLHPERLSVIARTSSMRYKNRHAPLDEIARELGVDYVLEGSARREGGRVRISATLIQVRDQTQRWTDTFDRELSGILALQGDVARGVAGSLALALLPDEQRRLASARPVNPEAYEAYLKGHFHAQKETRPDLDLALKYFEMALQKDPNYAPAHAGIAFLWTARNQMGYVPPGEAIPRVKAAALRAVELDPGQAVAHYALAMAAWNDWDWEANEREFRRTIELDPNHAEARVIYSHLLIALKRPEEAVSEAQRAMQLDPLNAFVQALYGTVLHFVRRHDEAIVQHQSALKTSPGFPVAQCGLWSALIMLGRRDQALSAASACLVQTYGTEITDAVARGSAADGYPGAMRRVADLLASGVKGTYVPPIDVFTTYLNAGQKDLALEWLSKSIDARDPNVYGAVRSPFTIDRLGDDPRFQKL